MIIDNLNPLEKAREIYDRHVCVSWNISDEDARYSAIITVDEILKIIKPTIGFIGDYTYKYYEQVKQELEKM